MHTPHPLTVTVYGIPHCDSVKKARAWLSAQGLAFSFHDFKKAGVPQERLALWLRECGRERLINRKGTTWRGLDAQMQALAESDSGAHSLALAQASVIKRPVIEWTIQGRTVVTIGVELDRWAALLASDPGR